ncbi:PTS sugar transporter subunit IIC [Planococcus glaciei]|uniref:PTS sugar transporter subunit IIC n=1 Tax=Planococcus glaciei TaxID=459472 RepID=A0A7H8Q899_9BACL|nr:PTS sugar transporter subunit IIC [Planococcus glaciei]ETP67186.1 membrane protein [Planococcus glaciei CHR43]QDY45229.1 PTS sugar transporter subunit IIC [Planococcus glaciei]QKX50147.1 PTS sugar transporter subunit IIC [Planococcus glaciei]
MKEFISKLLNGMSIGVVVALIPNALLGEILKLLIPHFPPLQHLLDITVFTMSLLPVLIGVMVGISFKLTPIQTASVGIASMVGSGVIIKTAEGVMTLNGIGIVLNIGITAALTVLFVQFLGDKLKAYAILLMPTLSILIPGMAGYLLLPYMQQSTGFLGQIVDQITTLQPVLMGAIIAMIFCIIILLPISTVGVATVIMLSGIGAGAANLGIVAAGVGLAITSYKANSLGTALAHVLGSPKIQMKNFLMKPKIAIPMLITAAVLGALAGVLNIQGTPYSAGFGLSGLVGPLNYMNLAEGGWNARNVTVMLSTFLVLPILLNIGLIYVFSRKLKMIKPEDYKLNFD